MCNKTIFFHRNDLFVEFSANFFVRMKWALLGSFFLFVFVGWNGLWANFLIGRRPDFLTEKQRRYLGSNPIRDFKSSTLIQVETHGFSSNSGALTERLYILYIGYAECVVDYKFTTIIFSHSCHSHRFSLQFGFRIYTTF